MANNFFIQEVFKSLIFSYKRVCVIFIAVFMGAMVSASFFNIYFDIDTKLSKELKAYGANFIITPKDDEFLSMDEFNQVKENLKAKALTPFLYGFYNLESSSAVVVGVDFANLKLTKPFMEVLKGSFSLSDFSEDSAFVGADLAKQLELKIGQELQIYNPSISKIVKVKIKAILRSNDEQDGVLIISLKKAQELAAKEAINYAQAILLGDYESLDQKAKELSKGNVEAKVIASISISEGIILEKIKALMALISLTILLISSLSVNTTLSAVIFSRKKEIALHLALGAKHKEIIKLFGAEVFVLSLSASLLGAFCGYFLANIFGYLIFNASIDFRLSSVFFAVLVSLVFAFFASILPLKKALKINVCENLKGE
ncbi:FtsX-like permease family protein [Campylobacter peloridis]|uniref:FtsX-like permease family protein n=1 Tax=Campylobacter peloridis TaxID=488546 RepID=A0ABX6TSZ5_9BACT|nr:FtsX-like permease family protein [Campylobacter peloridis]AJC85092.1 ferrirhodotorulic acid ABC transporter, permease protein [Campylobacter peloridis LMG 23910]QOQ89121.1 FtsX-like permease family protein [Campylobacter peloridis]